MLFVIGGRLRRINHPACVTDQQWNEIVTLSGLPQEARAAIDDYIGLYRDLRRDAQGEYPALWKQAVDVMEEEIKSKEKLCALRDDPNFFSALRMGIDGQDKIPETELTVMLLWLDSILKEKNELMKWLDNALDRLHHVRETNDAEQSSQAPRHRGKRKPSRDSLMILVRLLSILLHRYTGKKLSRGTKRESEKPSLYVRKICQIANPQLRDGTINQAIKETVTELAAHESSAGIGTWEKLMPGWKPATHFRDSLLGVEVEFDNTRGTFQWSMKIGGKTPRNELPISHPFEPFAPASRDEADADHVL